MSINHLTNDAPIKPWMNIGANSIKCTDLEATNLIIDDLTLDQLVLQSDLLPQLAINSSDGLGPAIIDIDSDTSQLLFSSQDGAAKSRIQSIDSSNTFKIEPLDRNNVQIEGPVQLLKKASADLPDGNHVSLYSKTGTESLYTLDSDGVDRKVAVFDDSSSIPEVVYRNTKQQFAPSSLTYTDAFTVLPGVGTNIIPAGSMENDQVYHIKMTGELLTQDVSDFFQFAWFVNGAQENELRNTSSIPMAAVGSGYELNIYVSLLDKDVVPGQIKAQVTGDMTTFMANPQMNSFLAFNIHNFDYTVPNTLSVGVKTGAVSVGNSTATYYASMTRIV